MSYFIQPSKPDRLIENWDEPNINNMIQKSWDKVTTPSTDMTVYRHLQIYRDILWDWSNVREGRINKGDYIMIYFSGTTIGKIKCLTVVKDIKYIKARARPLVAYLEKMRWYNDDEADLLTISYLKANGLNHNLMSLTDITNNDKLFNYLKKMKFITLSEEIDEDFNKD